MIIDRSNQLVGMNHDRDFYRNGALKAHMNRQDVIKLPIQRIINGLVQNGEFIVDAYNIASSGEYEANGRVEFEDGSVIYAESDAIGDVEKLALQSWLKGV